MKMKISNAFSLNMLSIADGESITLTVSPMPLEAAQMLAVIGVESCIGHADTAALVSAVLGVEIPANRATVTLVPGDDLLVAQYSGPRLPEGTKTLPEGATIKFMVVTVASSRSESTDHGNHPQFCDCLSCGMLQ